MSNGHRWSKFWWQDWQNDPALKVCGHLAKGVWMDLLCLMAQAEPTGHLVINGHAPSTDEIGVMIGMPAKQLSPVLEKLERNGVFSRTDEGVIYSRRMVRDVAASEAGREHIAKRWNGEAKPPPPNRGANSQTTKPPNRDPNRGATRDPNTLEAEAEAEAEGGSLSLTPSARATPPEIGGNGQVLRKNRALRTPIPADWQPSPASIAHAIRLGFDADWAQNQANRMRNWGEMSNAVVDNWDRRFDRWIEVESYAVRQAKAAATLSVNDQISRDWNLPPSLLTPRLDDEPAAPALRIVGGTQ